MDAKLIEVIVLGLKIKKEPHFTPVLDHGTAKPGIKAPHALFFRDDGENRREGERHISKH